MTMTVDEALKMFAESPPHCWDGMYDVAQALAAEVERLRELNTKLAEARDYAFRANEPALDLARDRRDEADKLREEAATARLALDVAQKEVERLQTIIRELGEMQEKAAARDLRFIEWVRLRQEWIAQVHLAYVDGGDLFKAVDELITFDLANPPPGATK